MNLQSMLALISLNEMRRIVDKVLNFDPHQPRDKGGKWSTTGGGGALSAADTEAIDNWWSGGDMEIQEDLRAGRPNSVANQLDKVIEKTAPLSEDTVMYRGLSLADDHPSVANLKVGAEFTDRGFSAITSDPQIAENFSKPVEFGAKPYIMEITVPKGTKAAQIPSGIEERLLARQSRFQITAIEKRADGTSVVKAKLVPKSNSPATPKSSTQSGGKGKVVTTKAGGIVPSGTLPSWFNKPPNPVLGIAAHKKWQARKKSWLKSHGYTENTTNLDRLIWTLDQVEFYE